MTNASRCHWTTGLLIICGMLLVTIACDMARDPTWNKQVYYNNEAKKQIERHDPTLDFVGMSNFYLFDLGGIGGSVEYLSFDYEDGANWWRVVDSRLQLEDIGELAPYAPPRTQVISEGPGYFGSQYETAMWEVTDIQNGMSCEHVVEDRHAEYVAVDHARRRVYIARLYGGIPNP